MKEIRYLSRLARDPTVCLARRAAFFDSELLNDTVFNLNPDFVSLGCSRHAVVNVSRGGLTRNVVERKDLWHPQL